MMILTMNMIWFEQATSIAAIAQATGQSSEQALGTALVTLSLSTALVGLVAILVGAAAPQELPCATFHCRASDPEICAGTALWATFSCMRAAVGRYKLAALVQYVPLPVIGVRHCPPGADLLSWCLGSKRCMARRSQMTCLLFFLLLQGFLAYVGVFCVMASLTLACSINVSRLTST